MIVFCVFASLPLAIFSPTFQRRPCFWRPFSLMPPFATVFGKGRQMMQKVSLVKTSILSETKYCDNFSGPIFHYLSWNFVILIFWLYFKPFLRKMLFFCLQFFLSTYHDLPESRAIRARSALPFLATAPTKETVTNTLWVANRQRRAAFAHGLHSDLRGRATILLKQENTHLILIPALRSAECQIWDNWSSRNVRRKTRFVKGISRPSILLQCWKGISQKKC